MNLRMKIKTLDSMLTLLISKINQAGLLFTSLHSRGVQRYAKFSSKLGLTKNLEIPNKW
jgi:hypothetical protein